MVILSLTSDTTDLRDNGRRADKILTKRNSCYKTVLQPLSNPPLNGSLFIIGESHVANAFLVCGSVKTKTF